MFVTIRHESFQQVGKENNSYLTITRRDSEFVKDTQKCDNISESSEAD